MPPAGAPTCPNLPQMQFRRAAETPAAHTEHTHTFFRARSWASWDRGPFSLQVCGGGSPPASLLHLSTTPN